MKIAQIAPLVESCPPRLYGGTERIVSFLTEELVAQGHEVTLFASGNSRTSAELVRCSKRALRLNPEVKDHVPYHIIMLDEVRRRADEFDVLHFHIEQWHFPLIRDIAERTVTTLHGRLDLPDLKPFYAAFPDIPLVSISNRQRQLGRQRSARIAARSSPVQSRAEGRLSRFPRPHLPGEATGSRDRHRSSCGNAAEDCRQDRQGRPSVLDQGNRAQDRRP